MRFRILVLLAAVLGIGWAAAPAAAHPGERDRERKTVELGDELVIAGHGRMRGSVKAPGLEVKFIGRAGVIKVVDVSGDTEVVCRGDGRKIVRTDDVGHEVTICAGSGGAKITGGEFRFGLFAHRLIAYFPKGAQGTVMAIGHWRMGEPGDERPVRPERPERPVRPARPVEPETRPEEPVDADRIEPADETQAEDETENEIEGAVSA